MVTVRIPEPPPLTEIFQAEVVKRNLDRFRRGMDVIVDRDPPVMGATPKDVVYSKGTMRLYRYRPLTDEVYRIPLVLVMSLISKPYILDLSPGQSLVEYLLREGFDVYMVDWGVARPRCIEEVQKVTGEREVSLLGYCMGGLFALMYSGIFHEAPVASLVCAATPVDFGGS